MGKNRTSDSGDQALQKTLLDPRAQWILASHQEAQSEYALTAIINGKPESIIIDRTFIDEKKTRWIIDYKTTFTEGELEKFLDKEYHRHLKQLQHYADVIQLTDKRPIRLGLYFPLLSVWKEWEANLSIN